VTRSFFDTNVLLYMYDDDAPEKKATALEVFEREVEAGRATLSTQVLQEFYVNATRKLGRPLSPERAEARVSDLSSLPLARVDAYLILAAIRRSQEFMCSFWDALIVESALSMGADRLLSEDLQHGQQIEDLRIENPFLRNEI
jgi:predicted nucleic acid-binding protein